jgi:membrane protease YdiL (CAAX protease family)
MAKTHDQRRTAAIVLVTFFLALVSQEVFRYLPGSVANLAWKSFWICLSFLGLFVAHRLPPKALLAELGLLGQVGTGLGISFLASMPMLVTLAATSKINPHIVLGNTLLVAVFGPVCEEILFRGYVFRQLYRRAGWTFLGSIAVSAGVFGLAHFGGLWGKISLGEAAGEIAVIAVGGAFFAWLLVRWDDNLWVPIGLHVSMNLWCEIFACDKAVGGWRNNIGRVLTVLVALMITIVRNRVRNTRTDSSPNGLVS